VAGGWVGLAWQKMKPPKAFPSPPPPKTALAAEKRKMASESHGGIGQFYKF
jgi:hypothetical protein